MHDCVNNANLTAQRKSLKKTMIRKWLGIFKVVASTLPIPPGSWQPHPSFSCISANLFSFVLFFTGDLCGTPDSLACASRVLATNGVDVSGGSLEERLPVGWIAELGLELLVSAYCSL